MNLNVQRIDTGEKLTEAELDAFIQASWPSRRASASQPMAAEACTEVDTDAAHEYDFPRSRADREAAGRFWRGYLLAVALLAAAAGVWRYWPA